MQLQHNLIITKLTILILTRSNWVRDELMPILTSLRHTDEKALTVGATNAYNVKLVVGGLIVTALALIFVIILLGVRVQYGKTTKERISDAITLLMSENGIRSNNPAPRLHV